MTNEIESLKKAIVDADSSLMAYEGVGLIYFLEKFSNDETRPSIDLIGRVLEGKTSAEKE